MRKLILLAGIALAFNACNNKGGGENKAEQLANLKKEYAKLGEQIRTLENELDTGANTNNAAAVTVATLQPEVFNSYIALQGHVDARDAVDVTSKMPAVVTKIMVKEGQNVQAGQLLAQLDNEAALKSVETLKKQLEFANTVFAKQKSLWDQKIGTELQFLQAKNGKETLEKQLDAVNEQIAMSKITAPISGTVDDVIFKIGQMAAPGMPLLKIVNATDSKVVAEVAESYAGKVNQGDNVTLMFNDLGKQLDGKISYVTKSINPLNRTFKAEVSLGKGAEWVQPNMIVTVQINETSVPNALVVPVALVQKTENGQFIMLNVNNKAVKREVTLGKVYNGKAQLITGVQPGDQIITTGYQDLIDGQALNIVK